MLCTCCKPVFLGKVHPGIRVVRTLDRVCLKSDCKIDRLALARTAVKMSSLVKFSFAFLSIKHLPPRPKQKAADSVSIAVWQLTVALSVFLVLLDVAL